MARRATQCPFLEGGRHAEQREQHRTFKGGADAGCCDGSDDHEQVDVQYAFLPKGGDRAESGGEAAGEIHHRQTQDRNEIGSRALKWPECTERQQHPEHGQRRQQHGTING